MSHGHLQTKERQNQLTLKLVYYSDQLTLDIQLTKCEPLITHGFFSDQPIEENKLTKLISRVNS